MKRKRLSPENSYIDAAIKHHELLVSGDPEGSNRAHNRLISAIRKIRVTPDKGREFLIGLLKHNNQSVRLWAACHLLVIEEKMALSTLYEIAAKASTWQLKSSAETTATEWLAGRLDPDWFMKDK